MDDGRNRSRSCPSLSHIKRTRFHNTLHTLTLYSGVRKLDLNKAGEKEENNLAFGKHNT